MSTKAMLKAIPLTVIVMAFLVWLIPNGGLGDPDGTPVEAGVVSVKPLPTPMVIQLPPDPVLPTGLPGLDLVQVCTLNEVIRPVLENQKAIEGQYALQIDSYTEKYLIALFVTESSLEQWVPRGDETDCSFLNIPHDDSEVKDGGVEMDDGTRFKGIGEVGTNLCDDLDWRDPWQNTYCAARYFLVLVQRNDGDFATATAAYKGVPGHDPNDPLVQTVYDLLQEGR